MLTKTKNLILLSFLSFTVYSQNQKSEKKWRLLYYPPHTTTMSVIYQKEFLFQFGQRITLRKKNTFEMFSLGINAQFQKRKAFYVSPSFFLSYEKPFNEKFGAIILFEFSHRKILGITSNTITPEIGLKYESIVSINYGYNLFLDNRFPSTSKHRVTLRITL